MMEFIKGMDVSSYQEMEDRGYQYFDTNGKKIDILEYAVKMGFNYGRIRIWNEPHKVPESGGYCSLDETIRLAQKMKDAGIPYLLDFHYSDWWADPGNQNKPHAWENLHGDELEKAVFDFTFEVLETLSSRDLAPQMVQVGNEIRCGMLWPDGDVEHFDNLAKLINAGIRGVRSSQKGNDIQIMIHLDQGGRYHYFEEWFDTMIQKGVTDFDIIGLSYYPFWHGSYKDLDETMNKLAKRYQKDLIVAETAYSYRLAADSLFGKGQQRLGGFPASEDGQLNALQIVSGIIAGVKDNRGKGFFYWEPFSRSEDSSNWGYCMGIVDENGTPLKAFREIKDNIVISIEEARNRYQALSYEDDTSLPIEGENLLHHHAFSKEMASWNCNIPKNVAYDIAEENGESIFYFESSGNVKLDLSQSFIAPKTGRYFLTVEYKGDNTTGVCIKPYIKQDGNYCETSIYPSEERWTRGVVEIELKEHAELVIGVNVDAPQIKGKIKNVGMYLKR